MYGLVAEAYTGVTAIVHATGRVYLRTLGMDRVRPPFQRREPLAERADVR